MTLVFGILGLFELVRGGTIVEMNAINMAHPSAELRGLEFPEFVVILVIVGVILLLRFRRR